MRERGPTEPARPEGREVRPLPDGVRIRPAAPRDAASFVGLYRRVAAERRFIQTEVVPYPARAYRRQFRRSWTPRAAHLVAVIDGRVIGSLGIERWERAAVRHVATLGMFVDGDWRGRGIGIALMDEAIRWAHSFGVEKIELTVYPGNEAARALYRRFGFVEEGALVRHSKKSYGYEDEILMGLWLGGGG